MTEPLSACGTCWGCGTQFWFDPDKVPSITIDPDTGVPPDVDPETRAPLPQPRQVQRTVQSPVCPRCVRSFNAARRAAGLPTPWAEPPDPA